ncbi:MAG: phosphoribosylanthranilate isomerase, partial [Betaproteobacteria bacterium]
TRVEDARAAAAAGADAIGLVFYPHSSRCIDVGRAADICRALPPFITTVALFVDAPPAEIERVLTRVPIDLLQFHGAETAQQCAQFGKPYMKALRVRPDTDLLQYAAAYASARALLLDAYVAGTAGGTGKTFDWRLIPEQLPLPVVLSGGLTAANVAAAIKAVNPWAVDIGSGVESAPGVKDAAKIKEFIKGARNANV